MTWNEFKKYVEERLSEKEKNTTLVVIDTGNYPELKNSDHIDVFVNKDGISIF
jgi:hypothetical protein